MPPQNQQNSDAYTNENIKYLDPREHVRKRPGLYIGGTDKRALHHMVWEVLDDAISEFENTVYNQITISLLPDKTICVADDGIGLPLNITAHGESEIELYMTKVGIGGRFQLRSSEFLISGGLHGIGLQAINALSSVCQVEVKRDGYSWIQTYAEGKATSSLEQLFPLGEDEGTGTSITFRPDFTIMEENDFDFYLVAEHCQELAYLLPQLRFTVQDLRGTRQEITYHYPNGLIAWLNAHRKDKEGITEALSINHDCSLKNYGNQLYTVKVQLAFQWLDSAETFIAGYANTIETRDGGTHIDAFTASIEKQFKGLNWATLKRGFIGIIHILHPDSQLESQTQIRLLNTDVNTPIDEAIEALFATHPEAKTAIQSHFKQA